ncbi:hypothetical protein DERP_002550 [Dermatophagoides pteronyssinus]|uniref:Uncharacterized protein n=1 Tax=Dermatophagoides pteronyssinus TaxID=6956 RepID=A0ABQ8JIJ3_DERPT|nr:hypothetical protein DERP_002550 [Dermatophagoides pteronyssinus]
MTKLQQHLWKAKQDKQHHHVKLIQIDHLRFRLRMEVDRPSFHTLKHLMPTYQYERKEKN